MARGHLISQQQHQQVTSTGGAGEWAFFGTLLLVACGSFAVFMCASHSRRKWRGGRRGGCYGGGCGKEEEEDDGVIIKLNPPQALVIDGQIPVWQKNILMGGKCQLPDFSGVILYDSAGNSTPSHPKPTPSLPSSK